MTQREKLVELLMFGFIEWKNNKKKRSIYEGFADYLLESGVIVPPCKAGDKIFEAIFMKKGKGFIVERNVVGFHFGELPDLRGHKRQEYFVVYHKDTNSIAHLNFKDIGKTVFFTKEEAEKALAEKRADNG